MDVGLSIFLYVIGGWYAVGWLCNLAGLRMMWNDGDDIHLGEIGWCFILALLGPIMIWPVLSIWSEMHCKKPLGRLVVFKGNPSKRVLQSLTSDDR